MPRNVRYFLLIIVVVAIVVYCLDRVFLTDDSIIFHPENPIQEFKVSVVAENLEVPWNITFLPSGEMLVTERTGSLVIFGKNPAEIKVPGVLSLGEGGLMGIAIHPEYQKNKYLYLYFTAERQGKNINRVVRYTLFGKSLIEDRIIIDNIPAGTNHNGGRLHFSPDKFLYITTGDSGNEDLAQDKNSLAGKILRLNDDGSIPKDNPFENAIYSYGHRNPQGITWDNNGNLWATEHGRSGLQSGYDEINLIEKGANYGWPEIEGDEIKEGMKSPIIHSGSTKTWAPSGIAYYDGALYFAGLRGKTLYQVPIVARGVLGNITEHFKDQYGRLRGVTIHSGGIYISTSNKDGRGEAQEGDDKILKIRP